MSKAISLNEIVIDAIGWNSAKAPVKWKAKYSHLDAINRESFSLSGCKEKAIPAKSDWQIYIVNHNKGQITENDHYALLFGLLELLVTLNAKKQAPETLSVGIHLNPDYKMIVRFHFDHKKHNIFITGLLKVARA